MSRWPILLIAALSPVLQAQSKFSARVESVRLDVLVTADGEPVTDLAAADFEVRDNGALQKVRMIGIDSMPLDVSLAMDLSRSVDAPRLEKLRAAGGTLLNALSREDRAGLLTFNHAVTLQQSLTGDFDRVRRALAAAQSSGVTSLIDAMYVGLTMADDPGRRGLLIVFSDGVDTNSWLSAEDVTMAAIRFETVVYAVSTAAERDAPEVLKRVTSDSGGRVLEVSSTNLESAFVKILHEFRQRYLLSYTLDVPPTPGWHRIDVRVKKRGTTVRARSGYIVGGSL